MAKKAIIHMSDLHISNDEKVSNLNTSNSKEVPFFADTLIKLWQNLLEYELYFIISGDITNSGSLDEYKYAANFLRRLQVLPSRMIILPGNHDVNWNDNRKAHSLAIFNNDGITAGIKPAYQYKEKFEKFASFYDQFYGSQKKFDFEKLIVDKIQIDDPRILIVGLNSCYKCNYDKNSGVGYIDYEKLKIELADVLKPFEGYLKIAVCHHNPLENYTENETNGFEKENWPMIKAALEEYGINTILFGHEHTPSSDVYNQFYYLSVGSLSKSNVDNCFNFIEIKQEEPSLILSVKEFCRLDHNNKQYPMGFWSEIPSSHVTKEIRLNVKPQKEEIKSVALLPDTSEDVKLESNPKKEKEEDLPIESEFHPVIFDRVKDLKIFKSGHFHWSDTSRAHNWIDIPQLLNNKEDIFLIQKSILKCICDNNIQFDLILGLGIEGNIIAARCAAIHDVPYTYLPYSYRYNDHVEYEKNLVVGQDDYKKLLIITDVVHDGKTIKKILIDEKDFFKNCPIEEINVITLFFTGKKYSKNLLNGDQESRFKFYYISKIRVEECPYKEDPDWKENCDIFCNQLDRVHEFYNRGK